MCPREPSRRSVGLRQECFQGFSDGLSSAFPDRTVVEGYPPEHETTNLCASTERRRA